MTTSEKNVLTFWPHPGIASVPTGKYSYHVATCDIALIRYEIWTYSEKVEFWSPSTLVNLGYRTQAFETKILFDMFHVYCASVCMQKFGKTLTTD